MVCGAKDEVVDMEAAGELGRFWPWLKEGAFVSVCVLRRGIASELRELEKLLRRLVRLISLRTPDGRRGCGDAAVVVPMGEAGVWKLSWRAGGGISFVDVYGLVMKPGSRSGSGVGG